LFQPIVLLQPVRSAFTAIAELLVRKTSNAQYDRLLASSCRPSVRLSVCNAVHFGSLQGQCTGLKVVPACS